MNVQTFSKILKNSYKKKQEDIDGYTYDHQLSGQRGQVYHNAETNHVVVAHRGSKDATDWMTNLRYAIGNKSARFDHAKKLADQAKEKYTGASHTQVGHSLGSVLAHHAAGAGDKVIGYNGPDHNPFVDDSPAVDKKNTYNIRVNSDPVSALNAKTDLSIGGDSVKKYMGVVPSLLDSHDLRHLASLPSDTVVGNGFLNKDLYVNLHMRVHGGGKRDAGKMYGELMKMKNTMGAHAFIAEVARSLRK